MTSCLDRATQRRISIVHAMAGITSKTQLNHSPFIWPNFQAASLPAPNEAALLNEYLRSDETHKRPYRDLFLQCEPQKLRALGRPMPLGSVELYRGVSGEGRAKGLSWTTRLDVACWFAWRSRKGRPTVYRTVAEPKDILVIPEKLGEWEYIIVPRIIKQCRLPRGEIKRRYRKHQRHRTAWSQPEPE